MDIEKIEQEIQILHMKLGYEDKPEAIKLLQLKLQKLKFQKEIAIIRRKIEQLG